MRKERLARGWFREFYEESRTWMPAGFRDWPEYEDKARSLRAWTPGVIDGLAQTEGYARGLLETATGVTAGIVAARLAGRMARQARVLAREDPPAVHLVIDHAALYRLVGSAQVMAAQMSRLGKVAAMPSVTVQVLPAVAHPGRHSWARSGRTPHGPVEDRGPSAAVFAPDGPQ